MRALASDDLGSSTAHCFSLSSLDVGPRPCRLQVEVGDADSKGPRLKLWGSWVVSKGEEPPEADPEAAPDSFNAMGTARIALADVLRTGQTEGAWKVKPKLHLATSLTSALDCCMHAVARHG